MAEEFSFKLQPSIGGGGPATPATMNIGPTIPVPLLEIYKGQVLASAIDVFGKEKGFDPKAISASFRLHI